jgi:polysaccharide chain length determinant protein (PEP-CTERM system associated)
MEMRSDENMAHLMREYADILWRRKLWVLLPFIAGILLSAALVYILPRLYRSTTLILIEDQKVPEEYVKSAVSKEVESRLSTIQQQILSRSLLKQVIKRFGLYQAESKTMAEEEIIEMMRKNIEINTVGSKSIDAFSLAFQGGDPGMVMNVTSQLASLFIEENLKVREQLVEGASEFLGSELKSVQKALEEQEARIGVFRKAYMGELPQQMEANLRTLDRFQSELQGTQLAKKATEERRILLEKTVEVTRQQLLGGEAPTDGAFLSPIASPEQTRLTERKILLAQLQKEYRDNYPDVIALKQEVEALEAQMAVRVEEAQMGKQDGALEVLRPEPPYLTDLRRQITDARLELARLNDQEATLFRQIHLYQGRVENIPMREQELATLQRDYESTKKNYQALLDKKLSAKISESMEKRQKGEQFRILDPANLPEKPFFPNVPQVYGLGTVLGLVCGIGLAILMESLNDRIRKPEEVERILLVPVLASIPDFTKPTRTYGKQSGWSRK